MIDNSSLMTKDHSTMSSASRAEPAGPPEAEGRVRTPAAAVGRQARRKAETRQRLLVAARELFVARGYDATRPQDIARAADLATGTFYLHFADKREAFLAFTEQAAEELMARIREHAAGSTGFEQRLQHALEALFDFADRQPGVLGAAFADAAVIAAAVPSGASLRDRLADSLARSLQSDMQRGELARDFDPTVIAHGIVGMIDAACVHGLGAATSRDELIANLTRFCARALAVAQPRPPQENRR
jgi:AcrR family transcriptional regulator